MNNKEFIEAYQKNVVGDLVRSFDKKEYLEEFLSGNIRLGHYKVYSNLKASDSRFNPNEGVLRNVSLNLKDGLKKFESSDGVYPVYSICFSRTVKKEYGLYAVRLNHPQEFHRRINAFLCSSTTSNYAGNMVYIDQLEIHQEIDDRLFHIYSDSMTNASKAEYRFSYDIFYPEALAMMPEGSIYSEDSFYKGYKHFPLFLHLKGIEVRDLCEVFS